SPAWVKAKPTVCYLTEQYRQDDANFLSVLSSIRRNVFGAKQLRYIKTRKTEGHLAPNDAPKLFSHNVNVDRVNNEILDKLPGETKIFNMSSQGLDALASALKRGCLSPEMLCLKVGAVVIFTKNNQKEGFVNGTLGQVEGFNEYNGYPVVKMRNGRTIEVEPMDWDFEEQGKVKASIEQLPLRLAWAITIHKSQGMSLDEAIIDLSGVFEFGQGYVALSRVRRLSGLHILGWNERAFQVHPEVSAKDADFLKQSESANRKFSGISPAKIKAMQKRFIEEFEVKPIRK
ncbi:MAG: AAA family ATPase, partial [Candidatus Wildermuthbacteria bacterium]|nr:AAA family ATPase [Candidatus Wildermuthbacteria bacterium]